MLMGFDNKVSGLLVERCFLALGVFFRSLKSDFIEDMHYSDSLSVNGCIKMFSLSLDHLTASYASVY